MKPSKRLLTGCLFMAASVWGASAMAKGPEFRAPPNAAVKLIGTNIIVENRATHIRQFYTRDNMEKVNDFYRQLWAESEEGKGPGYVETDAMPPWHIITRVEDEHLMTVQVQKADDGGSWGYLARSPVRPVDPGASRAADVPSMRNSKILNQLESVDIGQKADTLMLTNDYSLKSNIDYYKNYYADRGWREDMDKPLGMANSHILSFTSNRHTVNIVLTGDNNSTRIVINRVIHDLL